MKGAADAVILEDMVRLCVFLRERILGNAVVLEKLRYFHVASVRGESEEVFSMRAVIRRV